MKNIFLFLFLFICFKGLCQFPQKQSLGSPTTYLEVKGSVHPIKGLINGRYADTTAANSGSIDFYNGSQIFTTSDKVLWLRDSVANKWVQFGADSTIFATQYDISNNFLGSRLNQETWSSLSGFLNTGTSFTTPGNKLTAASGGNSNHSQTLSLIPATMSEYWTGSIEFTINSIGGGTPYPLLGIGIKSIVAAALVNTSVDFTITGATTANIAIKVGTAYGTGATSATITIASSDRMKMIISRSVEKITATLVNLTSGTSVAPITWSDSFSPSVFMHNTGQFSIWQLSSGFTVDSLAYVSQAVKNADLLIVGDSKAAGYFASDYYSRFAGLLQNAFPNVVVHAGPGDQAIHMSASIQEMLDLHPKYVLMCGVSNSVRNGESGYLARYDSIVTALTANGAIVYHLDGLYESAGLDQTAFYSHIYTTYPLARIIPIYDAIRVNPTAYLSSDGIHFTNTGHAFIFNTIVNSFKLPGAKTILPVDKNILNRYTAIQDAGFQISGRSRIRNGLTVGSGIATDSAFTIKAGVDMDFAFYNNTVYNTLASQNNAANNGVPFRMYAGSYSFNTWTPTVTEFMTAGAGGAITFPAVASSIDTTTYKPFVISSAGAVRRLNSWGNTLLGGGGGGSGLFPLTGTGTATGNIVGELAGNQFNINNGGDQIVRINQGNDNDFAVYDNPSEAILKLRVDGASEWTIGNSVSSGSIGFNGTSIQAQPVTGGSFLVNTSSVSDPITGNSIFKAVDANGMVLSFRDHSTGQGYLSISNGTMTGYLGHTNTTNGLMTGTYTNHPVSIVQANAVKIHIDVASHVGIGSSLSPSAQFHLPAGSASATYAPLKFTAGTNLTTNESGAVQYDGNFSVTKENNVKYNIAGTLSSQYTDVSNVGTGEDDLMTYTIPAGALSKDGDFIEFTMAFVCQGGNNKDIKVHFGAGEQLIYSSTSVAQAIVHGTITRRDATSQVWSMISYTGSTVTDFNDIVVSLETMSSAIVLKATGEATTNGDITQRQMTVKFFPRN